MKKGFTLIEVIVYIALFTILMVGGFVTAYQLIAGSTVLNTKEIVEEEGNFVTRKIDWAMTGMDSANPPTISGSGCTQTLTIYKLNFVPNPIVFRTHTVAGVNYMEMQEGILNPFTPITTNNVTVSCLKFSDIAAYSGAPEGMTATTTINGIDFTVTKYLRK